MLTHNFTEILKEYAEELEQCGSVEAKSVIRLYEMWRVCPRDLAALTFCQGAFQDWLRYTRKMELLKIPKESNKVLKDFKEFNQNNDKYAKTLEKFNRTDL